MYVRISSDKGEPRDFEFNVDVHRMTDEVRDAMRTVIYNATKIQPKDQNAIFLGDFVSGELKNLQKLDLPRDIAERVELPGYVKEFLMKKHGPMFQMSAVYTTKINVWDSNDYLKAENRMKVVRNPDAAGTFLGSLYRDLNKPRTVEESLLERFPELRDQINQPDGSLHRFLVPVLAESSQCSVSRRELKCYDEIFHDIYDEIDNFPEPKYDSSSMHTLFFGSAMVKPPFFYKHHLSQQLVMTSDLSSDLRLFVTEVDKSDICKYTPRSDFIVIEKSNDMPILICEVDSNVARRDCVRMVFQGVVACRQWRYVLPKSLKEQNRVLGLFVQKDFRVELYLFHADEQDYVTVLRTDFDLELRDRALQLARILFNYRDRHTELAGKFEKQKVKQLAIFNKNQNYIRSLTSTTRKTKTKEAGPASKKPTESSIPEAPEEETDSLLLSQEVHALLCPENTLMQRTEHERVAVVKMLSDPAKTIGFVKALNEYELKAFDVILNSGSEVLLSRVILPTKVIEVSGHSIAFLPYGGEPLAYVWGNDDGPFGHEVEIAWDLLTIVSHLHELSIAHLDIKPSNILWDTSTQSIRVIDFDSSEILDSSGGRKVEGVYGTTGFAAPEAESEEDIEFDPFLADAFSCGQVILSVVSACEMSEEQKFFHDISKNMCKEDAEERWSIKKAMQVWADWMQRRDCNFQEPGIAARDRLLDSTLLAPTVYVH